MCREAVNARKRRRGAVNRRTHLSRVRGNNQSDDVPACDWHTTFSITLTVTSAAIDDGVAFTFPISITAASGKVQQATSGIVTPPTGGKVEHYDSVLASSSSNSVGAPGNSVTLTFQVWYDLPNLRRRTLIAASVSCKGAKNRSFVKTVEVIVDP